MEVYGNEANDSLATVELPPGFRFHPTDEEIVLHYLIKKVMDQRFVAIAIGEADLNKCEPWDLPKKAKMGENEWFFFCQKDRKYPTGMRTNRATESGYWKATGKDKEIYKDKNCMVGMKKTLVFYRGRAPKGEKTNWVIHEYRLEGNFPTHTFSRAAKDEWVVCKVFDKSAGMRRLNPGVELTRMDSFMDHLLDSPTLPPLTDYSCLNQKSTSNFATNEDKLRGNIPSSKFTLNNLKLQMLQHDQKNFLVPTQNNYNFNINNPFSSPLNADQNPVFCPQITIPNSVSPYQPSSSSLGYHNQVGLSSTIPSYPTNILPFKAIDQSSLKPMAPQIVIPEPNKICKMEQFSTNNSINVSLSQDTGLSSEMVNETTSVHSKGDDIENKKIFDEELEGFAFSPNISDLDSLWSY